MRHTNATAHWPVLLAACWVTALLAGCAGPLDPIAGGNRAPVARLAADAEQAWTSDQVTFDLSGSYDPDGRIEHYLLDFGDGTTREFGPDDSLQATHTYTRGAAYDVTLTVTDDSSPDAETDKQSISLAINERMPVEAQVVKAGNLTGNLSEERQASFAVAPEPKSFEVELNLTNLLAVGASEIQVVVLDPVGQELVNQTVSLASGETQPLMLDGMLDQAGEHALHVEATQGGADVEGELRVLYA